MYTEMFGNLQGIEGNDLKNNNSYSSKTIMDTRIKIREIRYY